jgi:single-strand DNA-binding protein
MMFNKVILIGRLTRDPELRYTPNGHPVASFSLAVNRPFKTENGEQQTDFIDIVTWRKVAEQVGQYLSKGRLVAVDGRLQIRSYEDSNGVKRKAAEVVAHTVRFLDGRKPAAEADASAATSEETPTPDSEAAPAGAGGSDADVPF